MRCHASTHIYDQDQDLHAPLHFLSDPLLLGVSSSSNFLIISLLSRPQLDLGTLDRILSIIEVEIGHEEITKEGQARRSYCRNEQWADRRIVC